MSNCMNMQRVPTNDLMSLPIVGYRGKFGSSASHCQPHKITTTHGKWEMMQMTSMTTPGLKIRNFHYDQYLLFFPFPSLPFPFLFRQKLPVAFSAYERAYCDTITNLGLFTHHYVQYCRMLYNYQNTN